MYLIDSDYLINFLNGKDEAVKAIERIKARKLHTSVICVGEVWEGLCATENEEKKEQFEGFLEAVKVVDINREVIEEFAVLRGDLREKGKLIDNFDLLVAATCLAYNLTLVTGNLSHFRRIPGLKIFR